MKKLIVILSLVLICTTAGAQGIVFQEGFLSETLVEAKSQGKLVFIDVYTSWCGPCKMMSSEIFPQQEIGDFFNANFINFKADAEKSEDGRHIAKTYNVTAYPTFLFVNGDGELVYRFLGAKSLEGLIREGEKAVSAQQVYPELKKYEKQYHDGDRNMDFLAGYATVMAASGLDASAVLIDYLAQVDDEALFAPDNLSRIESITLYDSKLSRRIITLLEARFANPEKDEKAFRKINSSAGKYFSGTIRNIANNGSEEQFNEYLSLKERFMALGNTNSVSVAMLGGGVFYLPAEMLRLDYYNSKENGERFMAVFDRYVVDVRGVFEEFNNALRSLEDNLNANVEKALEEGDEAQAKRLRGSYGLMKTLAGMDNIYLSTALLEYIDNYDNYYTGTKDAAYRDRLTEWYVYLSGVAPSVKTALYAAEKLVGLGCIADAVAVLEVGLEQGREASEVTPEMISEAEEKLQELKNRK